MSIESSFDPPLPEQEYRDEPPESFLETLAPSLGEDTADDHQAILEELWAAHLASEERMRVALALSRRPLDISYRGLRYQRPHWRARSSVRFSDIVGPERIAEREEAQRQARREAARRSPARTLYEIQRVKQA